MPSDILNIQWLAAPGRYVSLGRRQGAARSIAAGCFRAYAPSRGCFALENIRYAIRPIVNGDLRYAVNCGACQSGNAPS